MHVRQQMCKRESENETMTKAIKPTTDFKSCSICKHIPDHKFVETLHTDARLPTQVDQLEILGGYGFHGFLVTRAGNVDVRVYVKYLKQGTG